MLTKHSMGKGWSPWVRVQGQFFVPSKCRVRGVMLLKGDRCDHFCPFWVYLIFIPYVEQVTFKGVTKIMGGTKIQMILICPMALKIFDVFV